MTKIRFAPALLAKFRRSSSSVAYFSSWLRSRGSASRPPRRIATLRLRCPFTDVAGRIAQRSALASTHAESGTRTAHGSDTCGSVTLTGTKSVPADAAHVRSHERYLHFGHRSTIFARTPERTRSPHHLADVLALHALAFEFLQLGPSASRPEIIRSGLQCSTTGTYRIRLRASSVAHVRESR